MIADAAEKEAPYRLTQYVYELATLLHSFYNAEKVINEEDIAAYESSNCTDESSTNHDCQCTKNYWSIFTKENVTLKGR